MTEEITQLETPIWVATVLDLFEGAGFFDEFEVAGHISEAAKKIAAPTEDEKKAANAERWAFSFYPQDTGELSEWKTHFGPAFVSG
jgi:hypothetical protein